MSRNLTASAKSEGLILKEIVRAEVFRARPDGYLPEADFAAEVTDLIVNAGRIHIAKRISGLDASPSAMIHLAIGTMTEAPALTDSILSGEVARKAMAISSALTNNVWSGVATFGGSADSVASVAITEAGIFNHAGSGQVSMMQRVQFAAVTLANSDLLKLTLETNVGSNTI